MTTPIPTPGRPGVDVQPSMWEIRVDGVYSGTVVRVGDRVKVQYAGRLNLPDVFLASLDVAISAIVREARREVRR